MQLFLDECAKTHEEVNILALTKEGEKLNLKGWEVKSGWWKGGTHNYRNPVSGQTRKICDVLLFSVNGHPIYI